LLSAKVGIVTGQSLPRLCRDWYRPAVVRGLWLQAELVAVATDLAEVVGAATGLNLLFGIPLAAAGLIAALAATAVLAIQLKGFRPFERAIGFLLLTVLAGFGYDLLRIGPDARLTAAALVPSLPGHGAVLVAVSIVGATIMPHVVYLHSALTAGRIRCRSDRDRALVLRYERWDVIIALGLAGLVNLAMLIVAAMAFAVALLASGISSSGVGTLAGQVVIDGFLRRPGSVLVRRAITVIPAIAVLAAGVSPTRVLVSLWQQFT
jgi:manganese transport protein